MKTKIAKYESDMTEDEARMHIRNLSAHNSTRLYLASFKSTSLAFTDDDTKLMELANEAKKVLGRHRYQQPYEYLLKEFPTMPRKYYDDKRIKEGIK